ncbi:unnamed protein product [Brassicogethes aeneus]|uniref:DH domain-containing protein n=1 Tax=Brassicogethes aeneus TaxID=1431903 RepID=A0A9P0B8N9_BRAAE|nr:unnamed protein product [Brassicogethes aeneus]
MYYQTLNPNRTKNLIDYFEEKISENMISTKKKKRTPGKEEDELNKELTQRVSTRSLKQPKEKPVLKVNDEKRQTLRTKTTQNRNNTSFLDKLLFGPAIAKPKHVNSNDYGSLRVKSTPRSYSTNSASTSSSSSSEVKPFSNIKIKIDENNDLEFVDSTPNKFERHHSVNRSIRKKRQKERAQSEHAKSSQHLTVETIVKNSDNKEEKPIVKNDVVSPLKQTPTTKTPKKVSKSGSFSEKVGPLLRRSFSLNKSDSDSVSASYLSTNKKDPSPSANGKLKNEIKTGNGNVIERKLSSSTFYVEKICDYKKNENKVILEIEANKVDGVCKINKRYKKQKETKKCELFRKSLIQEFNDSIINEATDFIETDDDVFMKIMDGQNVEEKEENLDFGIVSGEESYEIVEAINEVGEELRINVICMEQRERLVSNSEQESVKYYMKKNEDVEDIVEDYLGDGTILLSAGKKCNTEIMCSSEDISNSCKTDIINDNDHFIFELNDNLQSTIPDNRYSICNNNEDLDISPLPIKEKEMVEIRANTNRTAYNNGIRETTTDNLGNVRIELFMPVSQDINQTIQMTDRLKSIINELIETERTYIRGLKKVVRDYMDYVSKNCPTCVIGMDSYLFGNISEIYTNQKKFYLQLKKVGLDVEAIVNTFHDHKKLFELYPPYFKSKKHSERLMESFKFVIEKRQQELEDKLSLNSYLLTPVQRLGKYILLLKEIKKELGKTLSDYRGVEDVIHLLEMFMSQGNNELAIDSIKNHPYEITEFGAFLLRDDFEVSIKRKWKTTMTVFLFKKLVVFTKSDSPHQDNFIFEYGISIENLYICSDLSQKNLKLSNFLESKRDSKNFVIMECKIDGVLDKWYSTMKELLWEQLNRIKALHSTGANKEEQIIKNKSTENSPSTFLNMNLPTSTKCERKSTFYLKNFI